MRETNYLCRVPRNDILIILREEDYKYQRHHEENLRVPDPKNAIVLLAKGSHKDMMLFKKCFEGELTNVS